jgi:hypothetical protein
MSMTNTEIARRIEGSFRRVAWPDVGHEFFAATIEFRHDPAIPEFDGPWSKDDLLFNLDEKNNAWRGAISNLEYANLRSDVDGDTITVTFEMTGARSPDRKIAVPTRMHFTIADEQIVRIEAWVDQSTVTVVLEALLEGGYVRKDERSSRAVPPGG